MATFAVIAALLIIFGGPVVVINRDILLNRSRFKRAPDPVPLPFLIIPSSPGAADIVPAGLSQRRAPARVPMHASAGYAAADLPQASMADEAAMLDPMAQHTTQHTTQRARKQTFQKPVPPPLADAFDADAFDDEDELDDLELTQDSRHDSRSVHAGSGTRAEFSVFTDSDSDDASPDETVVFTRATDEAVQILPGRLHVLTGETAGEDLRLFSRIGEQPQIVVGRETGPAHHHITLRSPTVSRRHARMDFVNGHWTITNLSTTNPVLVNDRVLNNGSSARRLSDGDRIELGEVALRFLAS
jgi:FHA domain-containing protein